MRDLKCLGFDVSAERLMRAGLIATSEVEELRRSGPFDVILCFDVLEHVPYPNKTLALLAALSSEHTLLAINVPDLCSELSSEAIQAAIQRGTLARAVNLWEHLNYFTASNLHAAWTHMGSRRIETSWVLSNSDSFPMQRIAASTQCHRGCGKSLAIHKRN